MKKNEKLCSVVLASAAIFLVLILMLSTASAATAQSTSNTARYAYITNSGSTTVSVIDTSSNTVKATVNVGYNPYGVAVSPDGTKVYIASDVSDAVSIINTATNKVTATVKVGSNPWGVAVNPKGTKVYVANEGSGTVSVIDPAANKVTATVEVGNYPCGIAVSPDGTKVYVVNTLDNNVAVINADTNKVTATVNVGNLPTGVAVSPDGTKIYVTNEYNVSVIDTATNKVTATVTVGSYPWGVAVNPTGTKAYVTNYGDNTVSVIDTATSKVTATIKVGSYPLGIAINPEGTRVYVANEESNTVSVINTATNKVIATVKVGEDPAAFGQFIGTTQVQNPVTPVASFTSDVTSGKAPLNVVFTDTSTGTPTSWKWDFGDGTSSTAKNPTHKYSKAGKYTVTLTATNAAGSNTVKKSNYITVTTAATKPVAEFSASPTSGKLPLTVAFTDKSTGTPTAWKWDFGDGTSSTAKNPTHKYSKAGKYTVTLTATNAAGSNTVKKSNYITVTTAATKPVAEFSASPTSGKLPLTVAFTDKSTGTPTSWKWDFGDGTSSTAKNPTHKYSKAGKYTVTLTATNAAGSNTVKKSNYITVTTAATKPVAEFSASPTSGKLPLTVAFTDKSTGTPTAWKWDFGDGTSSTAKNPTHKYSKAGKYTVTLTATNAAGSNTVKKSNYITVTTAATKPVADFWGSQLSGNAPLKVTFTETSKGSPTAWKWDFGDGTSSTEKNPTHTYSKTGTYTVKLTATNEAGSSTKNKANYIKVTIGSKAPVADFWGTPISGKAPLKVTFKETSKGSPTSWKWDFGDGTYSTVKSPTHTYSKAGNYTVKLTATNADGSTTKTKYKYIKVTGASQAPAASFSASPTSGKAPLNVAFKDTSKGTPTAWKWNFGDGTTSTAKNPTHKYSKAGKYTVTLTATNAAGSNTVKKSNYITVTTAATKPVADFWGSQLSGNAPLKVTFTETSKGSPTAWKWDFGDGTYSTVKSPTHTYSKAGNYTVKLTATNADGSTTKTKYKYIKVTGASQAPAASFSASPTSGNAPLTVAFKDKSTGTPNSWKWNFGDGTSSTAKNPTHKYSKAGKYTVTLTAINKAGSNTVKKSNYITVTTAATKPVAEFSASPTSGKAPLNVVFNDKSTGTPNSWKWNFGDGTTSTAKNPTHKYSKAGKYTVTLTATNAAGSNTVKKSNYITVTTAATKPVADFWGSQLSGNAPLKVTFTETSKGSPTAWKWDFGDGTSSTEKNPTHTYSKTGTYTVKLTATNEAGSSTKNKANYIKVTIGSKAPVADFWGTPISGKAPLKVTFKETSKGSPTSWKWDFGDGTYSTVKSPTHTYSKAGYYTVKHTATNADGSTLKTKYKYIKVTK